MEQILIKKRKSYGAHLQQATSSSMLRHLVSELNNPASIRIQAHLNVLLISAPLNYIEEVWEGSDCYACYCRMIRSINARPAGLSHYLKLYEIRVVTVL